MDESAEMSTNTPLMDDKWEYFEKPVAEFKERDWKVINSQRQKYYAKLQVEQMLRMLRSMEYDLSFGYPINTYRHCLQSATKVYRDGHDTETVVTALFHDIGFVVSPKTHGEFAATLLKPYISEKNYWMLFHHGDFQLYYCYEHPEVPNRLVREQWRESPYFDWAAEFVEKYDQAAMDPSYESLPLEFFEPMVAEVIKGKINFSNVPE